MVVSDGDGFKCLQFQEDIRCKTHQGGISRRPIKPRMVNAHPNYENPAHCVVRLYEKYVSLLPETRKNKCLYMHARKHIMPKCWYLDYHWGINTIIPLVKQLILAIGVTNGNFKNQSLKGLNSITFV